MRALGIIYMRARAQDLPQQRQQCHTRIGLLFNPSVKHSPAFEHPPKHLDKI